MAEWNKRKFQCTNCPDSPEFTIIIEPDVTESMSEEEFEEQYPSSAQFLRDADSCPVCGELLGEM